MARPAGRGPRPLPAGAGAARNSMKGHLLLLGQQ